MFPCTIHNDILYFHNYEDAIRIQNYLKYGTNPPVAPRAFLILSKSIGWAIRAYSKGPFLGEYKNNNTINWVEK